MKGYLKVIALSLLLFSACKTGSKTTVKDIVASQRNIMPSDSIIQKQKKGIDIYAKGNEPAGWTLEVDFDKMISFRSADGITVEILPAFEKKEVTAAAETYRAKTDLGPMVIEIFTETCAEGSKRTDVTIQGKRYTGCGKYLFDHRLNDIWELESVNNEIQSAAAFAKGLPTLQFNLQENKMTGTDGCNNINSGIEIKGNRIKFSPFTSTKMFCNNNNKVEKIFSTLLSNKLVDYYLENNKLILYLEDDSKLFFKRKQL